jgi:hypothetical protein
VIGYGINGQFVTVKMVEVVDDKVKDLLLPGSEVNLREDEHKAHLFNAVEIRINKLEEGICD